jgi:hypothetical protein
MQKQDEFHESDWKLFRKKLVNWQEDYMDKLNKEYIALLSEDKAASEKFWTLHDRILEDKKSAGVQAQRRRSNMDYIIMELLRDEIICLKDLEEFSDDLKEKMWTYAQSLRRHKQN